MARNNGPVSYSDQHIAKMSRGAVVRSGITGLIGHIVGFSMNEYTELMVKVDWCDGSTTTIHNTACYFNF